MPVEEGDSYRLKEITFTGNKAVTDTRALRAQFKIKDGDIFDTEAIRKGLDNLRKAYAALGYINFTPVPNTDRERRDQARSRLKIDLDEGKQFFVRRIEFQGNTTTRDKVIRRELALEEGQVYNGNLWELSLLRLNQLQYFEAAEAGTGFGNQAEPPGRDGRHHAEGEGKGQEQHRPDGRRQRTFRRVHRRELHDQQPVRQGRVADRPGVRSASTRRTRRCRSPSRTCSTSRCSSVGRCYHSSYNYNQQQQLEVQTGQSINLPASYQALLQNYTQTSTGFTTSLSYPIKRSFKRVGITYSFDNTSLQTYSAASTLYFESLAFRGLSGPNALTGIHDQQGCPELLL